MSAPVQLAPDRSKFIGGSDASTILGINPWRSPLQLWRDKTQPAMPENADPQRMRVLNRGKRMEPYVVDLLAEETGLSIVRRNARYIDAEFAFLAAEIDAEAATGENVEIKTVSPFKAKEWGEEDSDSIPVHYTAQAQHGLMITGATVCIFGVLIGGDDFRTYRVERDAEIISALREREVAFWRDHIETLQPPAPTSADDVRALFPHDAGTAVEATDDIAAALHELQALLADAKASDDRIATCRDAVQRFMGDAARLTRHGRDLATWKSQTARRFDQRAFQAANAALFEQFIKTTESRVFRLR